MNELLILFSNNILPIFLAAGSGYLAAKFLGVNPRSLSQVAFYIFSPCLIFTLLTSNQLSSDDVLRMGGFTVISVITVGALTWGVGRLARFERRLLIAVLLTTMFSNAGNYGLSLNLFAFGEAALAHASIYFVVVAILMYTIGVFVASLGSLDIKNAFLGIFKVPAVYATILGLTFIQLGWVLPLPLDRTVTLLGNAAIPALMVLMGVQLASVKWNSRHLAVGVSNGIKLVAAPLLALTLSVLFQLDGAARQAAVIESAMPTAIVTIVLATEYDVEPSFVTTAVFTSTLLSPVTVTPLLALLGA